MSVRIVRREHASALVIALTSLAAAAWAGTQCIREIFECSFTGSGYCQGQVTACERGWANAAQGFECESWSEEPIEGRCIVYSGCAPAPCEIDPPSIPTGCPPSETAGQCCYCATLVSSSYQTEVYWVCLEYKTCHP